MVTPNRRQICRQLPAIEKMSGERHSSTFDRSFYQSPATVIHAPRAGEQEPCRERRVFEGREVRRASHRAIDWLNGGMWVDEREAAGQQ